jgi:hypothetical protein
MNTGYSILLREYIHATGIEYRDCEFFQIVCPACKEPVFKCVREDAEKPIHYLSHYQEKSSFDERCELRVAKITANHIEEQNGISREQKLRYFLSVLQDAVWRSEFTPESRIDRVKSFFKQIDRAKALGKFKSMILEQCRDNWRGEAFDAHQSYFDDYVRDVEEVSGEFYPTAYSLQVQKRIAWDMWQCLLSRNAEPNLSFLFDYGYLMFMIRIDEAAQERALDQWERVLRDRMEKLIRTSKAKGMQMLGELSQYPLGPPHSFAGSNLMVKLAGEVTHEMLGCLLRLPYFEMLKEKRAQENPE